MAEEQCCTDHAHMTAVSVGGYRVGSKPSHIEVLHNLLWYNRGIDWGNSFGTAEPSLTAWLFFWGHLSLSM